MKVGRKRKHSEQGDSLEHDRILQTLQIVLPRLEYDVQLSLSATCSHLRSVAHECAKSRLSYRKRKIRQSNYHISTEFFNPISWRFYRALTWLLEGEDQVRTRSSSFSSCPTSAALCTLARAYRLSKNIARIGIDVKERGQSVTMYSWFSPIFIATMEHKNFLVRKLYERNNSPDWRVQFNHGAITKSCIWHLATGYRQLIKTPFIPRNFPYKGFQSIHYISQNYAAVLAKQNLLDNWWKPGDPVEDILLIRLDTGQIDIIHSAHIDNMVKELITEHSWNVVGDIFLDTFSNHGSVSILSIELYVFVNHGMNIVLGL